jgi:hypothetical protein
MLREESFESRGIDIGRDANWINAFPGEAYGSLANVACEDLDIQNLTRSLKCFNQ